jgi:hypothetical protein
MRKDTGRQDKHFWQELRQARNMKHDAAFERGCRYMIGVFEKLLETQSPEKAVERLKVIANLDNTKTDKDNYKLLSLIEVKQQYKLNEHYYESKNLNS